MKTDHDLLIRVDENIKGLVADFSKFKDVTSTMEVRLRVVEDSITKLQPIPSVSHESVVKDLAFLSSKVSLLSQNQERVIGGWKSISIIAAIVGSLIAATYYILRISGH